MKAISTIVAGVAALTTLASTASAAVSVHVLMDNFRFWITIPFPSFSNLDPAGTAGTMSFNEPGLDPVMGFHYDVAPGQTITGADVTNAMGHFDFSGLGSNDLSLPVWGVWVTSPIYRIHVIVDLASLSLPLHDVLPDGQFRYLNDTLSQAVAVEVVDPSGASTLQQDTLRSLEWVSAPRVPAPSSAVATLAFAGLLAGRRRRS